MNSIGFILGTTLMYSTPLIYTSLGGVISERSGVFNIGLEGMMTMGAFIGATVGYYSGIWWLGLICAGIGAGLLALLHAVASVTLGADQVVSGIAINFLGPGLSLFLCRKFFDGKFMTKSIPLENKIPKLFKGVFPEYSFLDNIFDQEITVYLAFLFAIIMWFILYKTKVGLRVRAVGDHPEAADTLGISVHKTRYICVILSGVLSGFGGASMSLAVASNFFPTLISGQGFIALAAMIFGNWKPQGALGACLVFGGAQALVVFLGGKNIPIPIDVLSMIPYVLTIVILMGFIGKSVPPAADGEPYIKE
ncbi:MULTISPECIES: ABC transporter permease [Vallitalea]|jgi:simple sugar transport system permease protein|uniref:ABC transporter permease n=1 Tax=Vallitalea guaymasensis TaxID=1185412 RepID=A0A8J8MAZ3_9FIRM|nr:MULTISPECIES: ABC transporter permease [Vallitalea]MCT4687706.1 ABC transporter permease [Vallitalea sp.]QUH29375.1 ABC transporter permease [Vallitalea guaymasensis]